MSLRFIFGRAGSGKSYFCINDIKNQININEEEHSLILLVPEQFSFQAEKNLINMIGEKSIHKAQVLSFKRMAYTVFNEVGGITAQHMNEAGRTMLIHNVISSVKNELKVFNKAATRQGFTSTIGEIITELKKYSVDIKELSSSIDRIKDENLKNKVIDIKLIYEEFEKRLHEKYIDSDDDLTILIEKLDESSLFNNAEIWIDEFYSFTPQEYLVIEKLLKKASRVNISLCQDTSNKEIQNTDLFSPVRNTEKKLLEIINNNNIKYDKPVTLNCTPCHRFKNNYELQHLEKYMFAYPFKVYEKDVNNLSIMKALNRYNEVEDTAREIISLCRDKGYRYKDIAVVSGDLEQYENIVKAIFTEYEIPYFIDAKRGIENNQLIIYIISAMEIHARHWSYESVFRYLKTGLSNITVDEIDLLENYVLKNGIKGSMWLDEGKWEYGLRYDFTEEERALEELNLDKINDIRKKVAEPLQLFHSELKKSKTAKKLCEVLYNFLIGNSTGDKLQLWIEQFKTQHELDKANAYRQIWNIVMEVLDQVAEILGEDKINIDEFSKVLHAGFQQYEIGLIPPALDQILVSSVYRLKSHEIKALFLLGVNDGIFPKGKNEEGILNDSDRIMLRESGMELGNNTKEDAFEENFQVYSILTSVSDYVRLSYSISDIEGKSMRPSIIISRLKKIYGKLKEYSEIADEMNIDANINKIVNPKATLNQLVSSIKKDSGIINISPVWIEAYRWYKENNVWNKKINTVVKGFDYTNSLEVNSTLKIRKLYGDKLNISVSRLEKFSECPFSYFVQYGLRAKERKIYSLTSPDLGTFMHSVIQHFSNIVNEKNINWDDITKEWCEKTVGEIVEDTIVKIPGNIFNSSPRYKHVANNLKKVLTKSVWLITEHMKKGGFIPSGYEISFSKGGDYEPIKIQLHSGEDVELIGRVDRLDFLQQNEKLYLRIVDYKSGNKEFKLSDIYNGMELQLLIYLDAILTQLSGENGEKAEPGAILYFKLQDPIIKAKGYLSDEEIEKRIAASLKMRGLLLDDVEIIKQMDRDIEGSSLIVPVMVKKDGSISKSRSSVATLEQFKALREFVRGTIVNICEEILEGNISINPYKNNKKTPCEYCLYSAICQFDTSIRGNCYRFIKDISDEEFWDAIK
ncbi:MAG: ATP-dependent helicase [Clostridiaceae bacterium]|nr:ATP-dependent helicase [Clostridiaceae bacterium]